MRVFLISAALLGLTAMPLRAAPTGFASTMAALKQQTRAVRDGFSGIAALEVEQKGSALAPHAAAAAKLVARIEALVPPPAAAGCHSDALDGARRSAAFMNDMLGIYGAAHDAGFGPRITSAARHVDEGLSELETALAACAK